MIRATLFDGGTTPVFPVSTTPGCDELYFREAILEEQIGEDRREEINKAFRDAGTLTMRPWPEPLVDRMWIDWSSRNAALGDDGLRMNLYGRDPLDESYHLAPYGEARLTMTPQPLLDPTSTQFQRGYTWREAQAAYPEANLIRLDTRNEINECELGPPLSLVFDQVKRGAYRLELPDNTLFHPWDLRDPDRYGALDDDGNVISTGEWVDILDGSTIRLYLRPRRWRYVATVIVRYIFVSSFDAVLFDDFFTRAHFDRTPVYPVRHDALLTSQSTPGQNYFGEPRSMDPGIDWQWGHSLSSQYLRQEILDRQVNTLFFSIIFVQASDADVAVWRYAPRRGEVALGIGTIDTATGRETKIWLHENQDASDRYPDTIIGQYIVPFYVLN